MNKVLILLLAFAAQFMAARVVINEVCYDPSGEDIGQEWLELYNAGTEELDLSGCKVYSGGSSYTRDFVFPHFILRPGRFVLIGGAAVPNTHLTHNFSFQNGGSASDAICFVNADSSYTDTVIYDEPNSNGLLDDNGVPAVSFADDVPGGYSLARISDGYDTNTCATDFYAESTPTPGAPNRVYADYAISSAAITTEHNQQILSFWICNRSIFSALGYADLCVWQEAQLIHEAQIQPLAAWDSLCVELLLSASWELVEIRVNLPNDPNPENNFASLSPYPMQPMPPILNEIFAAPLPGRQEWLELFQEAVPRASTAYLILDASGNRARFTLPAIAGYYVLCNNAAAFLKDFPNVASSRVIQSAGWASLNNTGDSIYLFDDSEIELLDQISYTAEQIQTGKSLERHLDEQNQVFWRVSVHPDGASPGSNNVQSVLPPQSERLKLLGSPFDPKKGESLCFSFNLPDDPSRVNCYIYDLSGRLVRTLADNTQVSARGSLTWNGRKDSGSFASRGLYILLWESQSSSGGKIYRRQLTAVVK